jgi:hypothetical protein
MNKIIAAQIGLVADESGVYQRELKANYSIESESDEALTIRDQGPWHLFATITNAAESVVVELAPLLAGRRLFYFDSEGELGELLVSDAGTFAGFVAIFPQNE